jgi:hypothetical protein
MAAARCWMPSEARSVAAHAPDDAEEGDDDGQLDERKALLVTQAAHHR